MQRSSSQRFENILFASSWVKQESGCGLAGRIGVARETFSPQCSAAQRMASRLSEHLELLAELQVPSSSLNRA